MARNPLSVKADVVNELRNKIYYNELEIQRLTNTDSGNYKQAVEEIAHLLKQNVLSGQAIDLFESYFRQPAPAPTAQQITPEQLGLTKSE